jgi:hypothetical protein
MPPKDELNALLNAAIEMALHLIQRHGSHIPFAMTVSNDGRRTDIGADNTHVSDGTILYDTVRQEVTKVIQQNTIRALVIARNIHFRRADTGQETDAIELRLDHISGEPVTCYLPYRFLKGRYHPEELFAIEEAERFFPALGN